MSTADPTHTHAGRIVIDFYSPDDGPLYPVVSFDPVGRINPNSIDRHLGTIYRAIQAAQVAVRNQTPVATPRSLKGRRHAA